MKTSLALLLLIAFLPGLGENSASPSSDTLASDQIRELIRQAAAKDIENDKKQRDYTYIQREVEHKLDGKADGERVYQTLDGIAKRLDTDEQERTAISGQLDRQAGWIGQLADTTHTKLVPEQ